MKTREQVSYLLSHGPKDRSCYGVLETGKSEVSDTGVDGVSPSPPPSVILLRPSGRFVLWSL